VQGRCAPVARACRIAAICVAVVAVAAVAVVVPVSQALRAESPDEAPEVCMQRSPGTCRDLGGAGANTSPHDSPGARLLRTWQCLEPADPLAAPTAQTPLPRPSPRLIAAWHAPARPGAAPRSIAALLPERARRGVVWEAAVPGTRVAVVEMAGAAALQEAVAALEASANTTGGGELGQSSVLCVCSGSPLPPLKRRMQPHTALRAEWRWSQP
jgi:hypothetical protein